MAWWQRHFRDTTRGRVVALLRRGESTVEELASALGLTDNAVRAQLAALEKDGVVVSSGARREGTVGKPAQLYVIAPAASSSLFSAAYGPVLASVLAEMRASIAPNQLRAVLRAAGRRLAPDRRPKGSLERRVRDGAALLVELGGDVDVVSTSAGYEIRGFGCPLAQAVAACPDSCVAIEALLSDTVQATVREHCDRSGAPHCRFAISAS
jgi:predicted ArsR family transcriptional regulator